MTRTATLALAALALALLPGCRGDGASLETAASSSTVAVTAGSSADATTGSTTAQSSSTSTAQSTSTTAPEAPPDAYTGFPTVVLLTPETGVGLRPALEWEAVPGAALYMVVLRAPHGAPYWSWMGEATSIHVGGEPQLNDGALGPALITGMSWSVIAYDTAHDIVGLSPSRPISP